MDDELFFWLLIGIPFSLTIGGLVWKAQGIGVRNFAKDHGFRIESRKSVWSTRGPFESYDRWAGIYELELAHLESGRTVSGHVRVRGDKVDEHILRWDDTGEPWSA